MRLSDSELAGLVHATESIESTFTDIRLDARRSGPVDGQSVGHDSRVIGETVETLIEEGHLGGYVSGYRNLLSVFDPRRQKASPFVVRSSADLFDTSDSAAIYLDRWTEALDDLLRVRFDGVVLESITKTDAPDLGANALKARLEATAFRYETEFGGTLIAWVQGRSVASLIVFGAVGLDWEDAAEAAAREMDRIISASEALR